MVPLDAAKAISIVLSPYYPDHYTLELSNNLSMYWIENPEPTPLEFHNVACAAIEHRLRHFGLPRHTPSWYHKTLHAVSESGEISVSLLAEEMTAALVQVGAFDLK